MFEVTIRTDNQAALQKLVEFLASLNVEVFGKGETTTNGKKKKPAATPKLTVQLIEKQQDVPPGAATGKPSSSIKFKPGFGGAKGMITLSPDWDEPLEDFKEYM
ncbi:MAG: DUF2281 domain-containing protein [Bacteroidetes bacterium]|nr:DUF2281 domain-containing protein [Bacteroidota bacterium]